MKMVLTSFRTIILKGFLGITSIILGMYLIFNGYRYLSQQDQHNIIHNNSTLLFKNIEKHLYQEINTIIDKHDSFYNSRMIPDYISYIEWIPVSSSSQYLRSTFNHFTKADYNFSVNHSVIDSFKNEAIKHSDISPYFKIFCNTADCFILYSSELIVNDTRGRVVVAIKNSNVFNIIQSLNHNPFILIFDNILEHNHSIDLNKKLSEKDWQNLVLINKDSRFFNNLQYYKTSLPKEFNYNDIITYFNNKDIGTPTLIPLKFGAFNLAYQIIFIKNPSLLEALHEGIIQNFYLFISAIFLIIITLCNYALHIIRISDFFKNHADLIKKYANAKNLSSSDDTNILLNILEQSLKTNESQNSNINSLNTKLHSFNNYDATFGIPNEHWVYEQLSLLQTELKINSSLCLYFAKFSIHIPKEYSSDPQLIIKITDKISHAINDKNYLASLPNSTFGLITTTVSDLSKLFSIFNNIKNIISTEFLNGHNFDIKVGATRVVSSSLSINSIMNQAELAYQQASITENQHYIIYTPELSNTNYSDTTFAEIINRAKNNGDIFLKFDTIVDIKSNTIKGIFPQLYWKKAEETFLLNDFIEDIIRSGLNIEFGNWMIEQTLAVINKISNINKLDVYIKLNSYQFLNPNILNFLDINTIKYKIIPSRIYFIITEELMRNDVTACLGSIKALTHNGYNIIIGNFGSGYMDIEFLKNNNIQAISYSGSYTNRMIANEYDRYMISNSIEQIINNKNFTVIADSVDNIILMQTLKSVGINVMHGRLFIHNITEDDLIEIIKNKNMTLQKDFQKIQIL
ncbi:MAG: EAL domain-containing protein [Succinivibrionaceae bacterium]